MEEGVCMFLFLSGGRVTGAARRGCGGIWRKTFYDNQRQETILLCQVWEMCPSIALTNVNNNPIFPIAKQNTEPVTFLPPDDSMFNCYV